MTQPTETTFRQATVADAEIISEVISRIVKQEPVPTGLAGPMTADQVRTWLQRLGDQGGIFLCEVEGRLVGVAALDFNTEQPDTATLWVGLLAEYRRRGLGTQLAEMALSFARDRGYRRIRGRLPEGNEPALSFLSNIGALVPIYNPEMRFELPL